MSVESIERDGIAYAEIACETARVVQTGERPSSSASSRPTSSLPSGERHTPAASAEASAEASSATCRHAAGWW